MEKYELSKREKYVIEQTRAVCCVLVVFSHSGSSLVEFELKNTFFESLKYMISYGFGWLSVPMFFLISSILLYRKDYSYKSNIKKKFKSLLIPYFILQMLWIVIDCVCQKNVFVVGCYQETSIIANWDFFDFLSGIGLTASYPLCSQLWFLRDLFFLNIASPLIKTIIDKFPKVTLLFMFLLWFLYPEYPTVIPFINLQGIVFWTLGYYVVKYKIHFGENAKKKTKIFVVGIFASTLIITSFIAQALFLKRLSICFGILSLFIIMFDIVDDRRGSILRKLSEYNFSIYEFHEPILTALRSICKILLPGTIFFQVIEYVFLPIFIIFCCMLFHKIVKKYLNPFYKLISGFR